MSVDSIKKRNAEMRATGKLPIRPSRKPLPCVSLGVSTGETRPCKTCTGTIQVALHVCTGGHGICTETRLVKSEEGKPIKCCRICLDKVEKK